MLESVDVRFEPKTTEVDRSRTAFARQTGLVIIALCSRGDYWSKFVVLRRVWWYTAK